MVKSMKTEGSCAQHSDSNPSVVSTDVVEDTAIGVGEMGTKKRIVGSHKKQFTARSVAERHS